MRRPGRALPGHRQRHEGNGRGCGAGACPLWGRVAAGSRVPPCRSGPASVCPCLSASGLRLPCALLSGRPSWGVWALVCLGVRAIPGVRAPGRPGRSAPLGSRPEPAHTRASRAPDPQTKNGDLAPGATHAPLKGPGSLRPPPSTTLVPHFPAPDGPGAQTMLSPPKQRKIIKQGTVNSFPASLASAPAARVPNKLLDSTVCSMSAPGPRASDPPWGEEGEGGAEGAAPGEGCCCSRLSAPAPLPDGPRSGCSGPPPPGPHWLTRWGN